MTRNFTIWCFIGLIFLIYGLLITGAGIYYLWYPLENYSSMQYYASIVWGVVLFIFGITFLFIDKQARKLP
jgi:hypothetical protein